MGATRGCNLFGSLFGGSCSLIVFSIFLALKADGVLSWTWYFVFLPLWLAAIFVSWLVGWIFLYSYEGLTNKIAGAALWVEFSVISGGVFFTFFIALRLELAAFQDVNWAWLFIPLWIALGYLMLVNEKWPDWAHEYHADEKLQPDDIWKRYFRVMPLNTTVPLGVFTILLVLQLEGVIDVSWRTIFTPLWYRQGVVLMVLLANWQTPILWWVNVLLPLSIEFFITSFEVLLVLYLEGIIPLLTYALIPVWVLELVLFLSSCILPCIDLN